MLVSVTDDNEKSRVSSLSLSERFCPTPSWVSVAPSFGAESKLQRKEECKKEETVIAR